MPQPYAQLGYYDRPGTQLQGSISAGSNVRATPDGTDYGSLGLGPGAGLSPRQYRPNTSTRPPAAPTLDQQIQQMYQAMLDQYNPNGAYAQGLSQNAMNESMRAARDRGIRGPLSMTGAQGQVAKVMAQMTDQRNQLAQAGLTLQSNRDLGLQQLHQTQNQFSQNLAFQQAQAAQAQKNYLQEHSFWGSQGLGGQIVGGVLGAAGSLGGAALGMPRGLGSLNDGRGPTGGYSPGPYQYAPVPLY